MSTPVALADILRLEPFQRCRPQIMCGEHLIDRPVRWIHTSELAEAAMLLKGEELLLTSGFGLSGRGAIGFRAYIAALGERNAALALELGWTFSAVPDQMLEAAREHDVPVIALHDVVPFVELTEAGQEAILTRRLLTRPPVRDDEAGLRARLLQDLEGRNAGAATLARRLAAVGIGTIAESYCPVVVRGFRQAFAAALEKDVAAAIGRKGVPSAYVTGDLVLLVPGHSSTQVGAELADTLDDACRAHGEPAGCRLAVAEPGSIAEVAPRLADARHALSLAASLGIGDRVLAAPLVSARMVLNRLAGDALAEELVRVEIGKLIEYDRRHDTGLVRTIHTYLSHGSSTSRAAQALGCSRQSLYNRKAMIERLIGRFDTPERHANLVLALELHGLRQRFESGAAPHA